MDRLVTVRCFRVTSPASGVADFADVLLSAAQRTHAEREVEVDSGVTLRLERCRQSGPFLLGEFCRKRTVDIPPSAHDDGLAPIDLLDGQGIGHVAAFNYHYPTRVIALQSNRQSASPSRIGAYVSVRSPGSVFLLDAVLRRDAFERVSGRYLRKVTVRFASPENLEAVERDGIAAGRAAREMAQVYGTSTIEIMIQAGLEHSSHLNGAASTGFLSRLLRDDAHVEKLEVKALTDDGIEPVDLIQEQVRFSEVLDLPEANPDAHFNARIAWITTEFNGRLPTIAAMFETQGNGNRH